jgi:hypothetical protein
MEQAPFVPTIRELVLCYQAFVAFRQTGYARSV